MIKENYDILRFIEQNQRCFISSDCIKGSLLPQWIKKNTEIDKAVLFRWIQALVRQLDQIHKCLEKPYYQYVNPFCIVVSDDLELYLLDTEAKDNQSIIKLVKKREIREYFLPEQMSYYQKPSQALDRYGLGKTVQYMLSVINIYPELSVIETKKCQKLISKCLKWNSKKSSQDFSEIQRLIPVYSNKNHSKKKIIIVITVMIILVTSGTSIVKLQRKKASERAVHEIAMEDPESSKVNKKNDDNQEEHQTTKEEELYLELGFIEWIDLGDYQKSSEYFKKVSNSVLADSLCEIVMCFMEEYVDVEKIRSGIAGIESQLKQKDTKYEQEMIVCLLKSYDYLNANGGGLEDAQNTIVFCDQYLSEITEENQIQMISSMALAYEKLEEKEKAITMYEQILRTEEDVENKEVVFLKISQLFIDLNKLSEAKETLKEGLKECKESTEIGLFYVRILLSDLDKGRKEQIENINLFLTEYPYLKEDETLQQLLLEKGMQMRGDIVCEKE